MTTYVWTCICKNMQIYVYMIYDKLLGPTDLPSLLTRLVFHNHFFLSLLQSTPWLELQLLNAPSPQSKIPPYTFHFPSIPFIPSIVVLCYQGIECNSIHFCTLLSACDSQGEWQWAVNLRLVVSIFWEANGLVFRSVFWHGSVSPFKNPMVLA